MEARQREADEARGREPGSKRNRKSGRPYKREYGEPDEKAQDNFTDPESRIMKTSSEGFQQCYNAQVAVEGEKQLIVATEVSSNASDQGRLVRWWTRWRPPMGNGPRRCWRMRATATRTTWRRWRRAAWTAMWPWAGEGRRAVAVDAARHPAKARMAEKLSMEAGRVQYAQRKWLSEAPNGWIKEVLGFRRFSLRGLNKVQGEWNLVCLALNVKRMQGFRQPDDRDTARKSGRTRVDSSTRGAPIGASSSKTPIPRSPIPINRHIAKFAESKIVLRRRLLAALIGIEDFRLAVAAQRLLELLDAKAGEVEREIRRPAGFCQEQTTVMIEQFSRMERDAFHLSYLSDKIPEDVFLGQVVKTVAYLILHHAEPGEAIVFNLLPLTGTENECPVSKRLAVSMMVGHHLTSFHD